MKNANIKFIELNSFLQHHKPGFKEMPVEFDRVSQFMRECFVSNNTQILDGTAKDCAYALTQQIMVSIKLIESLKEALLQGAELKHGITIVHRRTAERLNIHPLLSLIDQKGTTLNTELETCVKVFKHFMDTKKPKELKAALVFIENLCIEFSFLIKS